jgi:hypothetical protein
VVLEQSQSDFDTTHIMVHLRPAVHSTPPQQRRAFEKEEAKRALQQHKMAMKDRSYPDRSLVLSPQTK